MKKYILLCGLFLLVSLTSCLESGLDDLPEYEGKEIIDVQRVEYSYISDEQSPASGQNLTKYVTLDHKAVVDKDARTVKIAVTVPAESESFPSSIRNKCSKSNISVMVKISTAARATPVGGAPRMGIAGDWSKANKYIIAAADGSKVDWTVEVTEFNK